MTTSDIDIGLSTRFREAFRCYPTGVALIAAAGPDGPAGLTASSVSSVSVAPPALSFSVMGSPSARVVTDASAFVVHLLGPAHAAVARDFARPGAPRFTPEQGWDTLPTGEPLLRGAQAALRCRPLHLLPVGTSTVVVAEVVDISLGPDGDRLIHHDRTFSTVTAPKGH
ncbi:flavin reductase family protein [Catenuloplanes atrovinosus]|uniref:Flavin reductase (DIM6/NTAB) family NADH-FMN oxidoreductase RutF n=1 Tax=Catenuloplanes atrovinosus TaxID=137266 RepID=A0AAE3YQT1_9ACTN|nr:flavin reductase family protein [Catenuloplanes atrovinosus]MDR7276081.1 flavin reductase (DIM6/NTAB) family NADH-FMN oxidoreductase RutF [Catenuloplanes atrovinosus]